MNARSDAASGKPPLKGFHLRTLIPTDRVDIEILLKNRSLQHLLLAFPPEDGSADVDRWIGKRIENGSLVCFAVADRQDRFCGFVQISGWHKRGRYGWLGMALMPDERARGLGRWALQEIIEKARRDLGLRKMLLEVRADNAPAIGLYETMGFRAVGTFRDHYFDGVKYHDVAIMERMIGRE